jgi:hypothetical protein
MAKKAPLDFSSPLSGAAASLHREAPQMPGPASISVLPVAVVLSLPDYRIIERSRQLPGEGTLPSAAEFQRQNRVFQDHLNPELLASLDDCRRAGIRFCSGTGLFTTVTTLWLGDRATSEAVPVRAPQQG